MWQFSLNFIDLLKWLGPLLIILSVAVFFKKEKATLLITLIITYFLIVFGSYVRLTDSGLGCPDWPGCYAQLSPFGAESEIEYEENLNPLGYVTKEKAWIEMLHRYLATIVGVLIVSLFIFQIINLFKSKNHKIFRYGVLLFLVIIQGLFGKWTVTMELKPIIVTSHLLFGFTVFTYMSWIYQSNFNLEYIKVKPQVKLIGFISLFFLFIQIYLGAWVSTNYASLACTSFPYCNFNLSYFSDFFSPFRELSDNSVSYETNSDGLVMINMVHRIFAIIVTLLISFYLYMIYKIKSLKPYFLLISFSLVVQVTLGIFNVIYLLPIYNAVLHNGFALLLLTFLVLSLSRIKKFH